MQCDICTKKKATVHLTEIVDGKMSEMHLCEECAHNKSSHMEQQFGLGDLLAGLSDVAKPTGKSDKNALLCGDCGLNYEDFRKFGRLGCAKCYLSFKDHLAGLLRKIHGSQMHLGKTPVVVQAEGTKEQVSKSKGGGDVAFGVTLEDLRKQLLNAIEAEDFEKAAFIRDKIRSHPDSSAENRSGS